MVGRVFYDIKNDENNYARTCGKDSIDINLIKQSIDYIINSKVDYEFRTTVIDEFHKSENFEGIGQLIQFAQKYFLQCYTYRDTVPNSSLSAPTKEKLEAYANIMKKYVSNVTIRGVD